jgi:hypothetical protein
MSIEGVLDARRLVGDWHLERWESVGDDGSLEWPMGQAVEGVLLYSADGTMITTIAPADRPRLSSTDPLRGGPDDERRGAAETFIAYAGRFHVEGQQVIHEVAMSLYPNWVGTRQARHVQLREQDQLLELSTDPFTLGGRRARQRLTWRRSGRPEPPGR